MTENDTIETTFKAKVEYYDEKCAECPNKTKCPYPQTVGSPEWNDKLNFFETFERIEDE